ncbi:MAG: Ig-like domain-containing protein, partial [bacterium]
MTTKKTLFLLVAFMLNVPFLFSQLTYDYFDGNVNDPLDGLNTGDGWAGAWVETTDPAKGYVSDNEPVVTFEGLTNTTPLFLHAEDITASRQLDVSATGNLGDYVDASGNGIVGKPIWFSILFRTNTVYAWAHKFGFGSTAGDFNDMRVSVDGSNKWILRYGGGDFTFTDVAHQSKDSVLIVLKLDYKDASNMDISGYLNPTGASEPATPDVEISGTPVNFSYLSFQNFNADVEGIRIGGSYADVVPAGDVPTIDVTGVNVDPTTASVNVGATTTLAATVEPADASDKTVEWESRDESIASVTDGVVTGVADGSTYIVVVTNDGGFMDSALVTVTTPSQVDVTGITLDPSTVSVKVDETTTLTATIEPADASDKTVEWESRDESIASVTD